MKLKSIGVAAIAAILFLCSFRSAAVTHSARVSLLTCSAGEELYSTFGHTALRFTDTINGKWVDLVFNYGTFQRTATPSEFYLNFARGRMNYLLDVQTFGEFQYMYITSGRGIFENELLLTYEQKAKLFELLMENAKPENQVFAYDFFYDNCATRVRDILKKAIPELDFGKEQQFAHRPSLRDDINFYMKSQPWATFGISLVLGLPCDRIPDDRVIEFLPDSLQSNMKRWTINGQKLMGRTEELLPIDDSMFESSEGGFTPWKMTVISSLIFGLFSVYLWVKKRPWYFTERLFFGIIGTLGLVLFLMWFATDHKATAGNMNLLWANPILLVFAFVSFKRSRAFWKYFVPIQILASSYVLIATFVPAVSPEGFPREIMPWLLVELLLLLRYHKLRKASQA
jgi:Domain of unknown function (DUF4105)